MSGEAGNGKMKKLPVGKSDFKAVIEGDYCYIDKTLFIKEIIDRSDTILLVPRPRRFGKTLNLSMLKYFYDCVPPTLPFGGPPAPPPGEETPGSHPYKTLFQSLAIMNAGKPYLDKMGTHPVIFLSFRSIKELDWESCLSKAKRLIQDEYLVHDYLLSSPALKVQEKDYFRKIINFKGSKGDYEISLEKLLIFLYRHYRKRPVILIDEYDAPVHAGFVHGYYDEIINFMRNFLCGGLKDTDQYLEKSVLTGIMRIAKESIFSGLNNLGVFTLLSEEFSDKFGFTEEETEALLEEFQLTGMYDQVRQWYNGYRFGSRIIYNPWSIINFLASDAHELKPYWLNTSNNEIVETLLSKGGKELRKELELLIRGESIRKTVNENIILKYVAGREELLWSFLLMGGYLKQTEKTRDHSGSVYCTLSVPNLEVRMIYRQIIDLYFTEKISSEKVEIMLKALIEGDIKLFEKMLRKVVMAVFSYHDFGGEPEKVYHALVAGLLIWISGTHEIKSNRESGYGRYDIMIIPRPLAGAPTSPAGHPINPKGVPTSPAGAPTSPARTTQKELPGYVIEFKAIEEGDEETVPEATETALKQIEEKKYETELIDRGIKNIKKLAIVFSGKQVYVKEAGSQTTQG